MWDPHTGEERPYEVQQFYSWSRDRALMRRAEKSAAAANSP